MYEVPIDIDRPIADTPTPQQPNIPAPIALYQGGNMQWLTPRNMAIAIGGVIMLSIMAIAVRGSGSTIETIKVGAIQITDPSSADVNKVVLENSKTTLSNLKLATDLKIEEVRQASINERSQEILLEAQRHVTDPKSGCFRSPYGTTCYITIFIDEEQLRYADAIAVRQWNKANNALFDVKAARTALDGINQVPFSPAVTSAAIIKENEARINLAKQSDNAIASDIYGVKKK